MRDPQPRMAHLSEIEERAAAVKRCTTLRSARALCHNQWVSQEWIEMVLEVPEAASDAIANFLMEQGCAGLQSEDRGATTKLTMYFRTCPALQSLYDYCADLGYATDAPDFSIRMRTIGEEDWAESWKQHSRPISIGEHLYVCPSWDAVPPAGRIAVVIDPGMAFGTGQHPSTRGCLVLIERAVAARAIPRALDLGCGSGVLAIALAKLGVGEVQAVDTDACARRVAASNSAANGVGAQVRIAASVEEVSGTVDLVVANLFADMLIALVPQVRSVLKPGGSFICSGLLSADEQRVGAAYASSGFMQAGRYEEESWLSVAWYRSPP